ncbi:hypothetical protein GX645_01830 [Candidatus Sumerlaeota bacterium]|nr:hypothetical protein [Candidatus Sumerlaeota bacterium]
MTTKFVCLTFAALSVLLFAGCSACRSQQPVYPRQAAYYSIENPAPYYATDTTKKVLIEEATPCTTCGYRY